MLTTKLPSFQQSSQFEENPREVPRMYCFFFTDRAQNSTIMISRASKDWFKEQSFNVLVSFPSPQSFQSAFFCPSCLGHVRRQSIMTMNLWNKHESSDGSQVVREREARLQIPFKGTYLVTLLFLLGLSPKGGTDHLLIVPQTWQVASGTLRSNPLYSITNSFYKTDRQMCFLFLGWFQKAYWSQQCAG